ncbi:MAG: AI-2E family transporter [Neisseriaceae bacterium]|nr:AI-2E family transporter [Neisseriaceae bacterium]
MYRRRNQALMPWVVFGLVLFVFILLITKIKGILTPFVVGAIFAYILSPFVTKLTKRRIKRTPAVLLVLLMAVIVVALFVAIVVPMLVHQFDALFQRLPGMVHFVQDRVLPKINSQFGTQLELDSKAMLSLLEDNSAQIRNFLNNYASQIIAGGSNVVGLMTNLFLMPFVLYYLLLDWPNLLARLGKLIPRRFIGDVKRITHNLHVVLREFISGQLLVMLIMGLIYGIGLWLTGLESGFAIGMVAGMLVFVPYVGAFLGLLLATMAAVLQFDAFTSILLVWAVFAIGQTIESFLVTPYLVGDRIGLSPLAVIFALMAFGELMGFVGMLLALPMAAITVVLAREGLERYEKSRFYQRKQQPLSSALPREDDKTI